MKLKNDRHEVHFAEAVEINDEISEEFRIPGNDDYDAIQAKIEAKHGKGGDFAGIPAADLRPGMLLSWNYSPKGYEVVAVRPISANFIEIDEKNRSTGKITSRRLKKTRLVVAT